MTALRSSAVGGVLRDPASRRVAESTGGRCDVSEGPSAVVARLRKLAGCLSRVGGVVGRPTLHAAGLGMRTGVAPAGPGSHRTATDERVLRVRCAWCGCFRTGDTWTVIAPVPPEEDVTHGICPRCFSAVDGTPAR